MDTTLQELRRRAAQTGSPEDRAAELRARVRAGDVTQEMLELAAYCGDEGALCMVQDEPRAWGAENEPDGECPECGWYLIHRLRCSRVTLPEFIAGLGHWRHAVRVVAGVAAAKLALPIHERPRDGTRPWGSRYAPRRAIEAIEAWLACPCESHREACRAALPRNGDIVYTPAGVRWWAHVLCVVALDSGPVNAIGGLNDHEKWTRNAIYESAACVGDAPVFTAIRAALVAYALGAPRA